MLKYETYDHELRESKKHKHIFFLKTHRTGSSTLQNILFRYGYRRNLTFALPAGQSCRFGYPMPLSLDHIQNLNHSSTSSNPDFNNKNPSSSINIFAHQARLNTNIFNDPKLLPSIFSNNKPYKITILRNPTTLLPSVFQYYNLEPVRLVQYNLTKFLGDTSKYYGVSDAEKNKLDFGLTRNGQTFDLGFAGIFHFSPPGIRQVIQETDDFFDLVMINEYFDESLILLKNELNWDFEDLLYRVACEDKNITKLNFKKKPTFSSNFFFGHIFWHNSSQFYKCLFSTRLCRVGTCDSLRFECLSQH